ncbi:hypothetical protein [Megasphaera stantonii]|jgi:hypothetical protein|uniref:hypothetical protein n=1 Tax=Megasphaera stantonii TaxID=2144175 RepID=UPI002942B80C|nr:hypothetical protein [Megasphaera stantonii]
MQYYGDLLRKLTNSNTTDVCEFFVKKCLMNARNRSTNEGMKRFFMICGVSANDGIKEFLEKNELVFSGYWAHRRYFTRVKDKIPYVVKTYLSCILLMLGPQKELIMQKTGLSEEELLSEWCRIFKYDDADKEYFNRLASMSRSEEGINRIFNELNQVCHDGLNGGEESNLPVDEENRERLKYRVGEDAYILVCRLEEMPNV